MNISRLATLTVAFSIVTSAATAFACGGGGYAAPANYGASYAPVYGGGYASSYHAGPRYVTATPQHWGSTPTHVAARPSFTPQQAPAVSQAPRFTPAPRIAQSPRFTPAPRVTPSPQINPSFPTVPQPSRPSRPSPPSIGGSQIDNNVRFAPNPNAN